MNIDSVKKSLVPKQHSKKPPVHLPGLFRHEHPKQVDPSPLKGRVQCPPRPSTAPRKQEENKPPLLVLPPSVDSQGS